MLRGALGLAVTGWLSMGCTTPRPVVFDAETPDAPHAEAGRDTGGGLDAPSAEADGGALDAPAVDAGSDAGPPRCTPGTPFRDATLVTSLSSTSAEDDGLTVTPDELEAIVRSGNEDTFWAHVRASTGAAFGPAIDTGVTMRTLDDTPFLSADHVSLYFGSRRVPGGSRLYVATREADGTYTTPLPVPFASRPATDELGPFVVGRELYFSAAGPSRGRGIYLAIADGSGTYPTPSVVTELDSANDEGAPVVSADGLEIFFARNGAGLNDDVWSATRERPDRPWTDLRVETTLRTPNEERPEALSADGCRLYLVSNRGGTWDVYVAERAP